MAQNIISCLPEGYSKTAAKLYLGILTGLWNINFCTMRGRSYLLSVSHGAAVPSSLRGDYNK